MPVFSVSLAVSGTCQAIVAGTVWLFTCCHKMEWLETPKDNEQGSWNRNIKLSSLNAIPPEGSLNTCLRYC
jgi:hypothetical protein